MKERLDQMRRRKEEIQDRISQKKEIQLKIKETIKGIPKMEEEEVVKMAKVCKKNRTVQPQDTGTNEEICEREVMKKALENIFRA